ncbi:MAG: sulfite exporter TauE/SafE family protein [Candidatus Thermoplasmatota archaeon]|nr:sulfite exporter TauE/SafE family protein [Euryarchaeota archaeon]MBU4031632.1 sulfite exporter TauE/SafE family protein [Candidatus Thermoplasmatota archaeon]MBU4071712.1 sulfite exporter TauE/SafE family protein [Candidatus Thermoplasmatota archaeon]MBU4143791.1 sulfite exporter TauE/SafE family protein [Candidatus Thermoplasmatota archaeon]MBU4591375.1 sulfite exporter TauE/SafE family protein [Candidatus Thermoplasmatota archaeon]
MMDITWAIVAAIIVILIGGIIQGLSGFGFSQFSLPLLVLMLASAELIPIMVILSLFLNILMVYSLWKDVQVKRIWPMMFFGVLGIPLGVYLLNVADANALKIMIGSLILIFGLAQLFNIRKHLKAEKAAMAPIGFAGGILNGYVSMSGPPLILFFSNQGFTKQEFRANLVVFFLFINIATLPFFLYAGYLTETVVSTSAILLPGMLLGTYAGMRLANRVDESKFKKGVLMLLLIFGCMSIAGGLGAF